jgi:hypothetical protein
MVVGVCAVNGVIGVIVTSVKESKAKLESKDPANRFIQSSLLTPTRLHFLSQTAVVDVEPRGFNIRTR